MSLGTLLNLPGLQFPKDDDIYLQRILLGITDTEIYMKHVNVAYDKAGYTVIATIITTTHGCERLDSNTKEPQKRRETRMAGCHLKCWIVRKTRICFVVSVQQTLLQEKSSDPESWGTEY